MTGWQIVALAWGLIAAITLLLLGWALKTAVQMVERRWQFQEKSWAPNPEPRPRAEITQEQRDALDLGLLRFVHQARGSDQATLDAWREEKRLEGWTDGDVEEYLRNRTPLELF